MWIRHHVFPVLAAMIWGLAFVAQSVGAGFVEAFTFNAVRSLIAFVLLLTVCVIRRKRMGGQVPWKTLLLGGGLCGIAMTVATYLQQLGLETTSSGKAGFITALYIVLVPLLGLFFRRRVSVKVGISVVLAVAGLYLLCVQDALTISPGDLAVLLCAVCFSVHILVIDHFTHQVDGIELSCTQFGVMTVLSAIGMFAGENPTWSGIVDCAIPILYVGIFSSGVGYTLQILAQKDADPAVVSLLMSLESVFAVLFGALILGDTMTTREYMGCALMMVAVVLAQWPSRKEIRQQAQT